MKKGDLAIIESHELGSHYDYSLWHVTRRGEGNKILATRTKDPGAPTAQHENEIPVVEEANPNGISFLEPATNRQVWFIDGSMIDAAHAVEAIARVADIGYVPLSSVSPPTKGYHITPSARGAIFGGHSTIRNPVQL